MNLVLSPVPLLLGTLLSTSRDSLRQNKTSQPSSSRLPSRHLSKGLDAASVAFIKDQALASLGLRVPRSPERTLTIPCTVLIHPFG